MPSAGLERYRITGSLWLERHGRNAWLVQHPGGEKVEIQAADVPTLYAALAEFMKHGDDVADDP